MIDLIGHRGARALFPENTLEGFRAARDAGFHWFEIDVAMTRDGVAVISHDPRLSPDLTRSPDGRWLMAPSQPLHRMDFATLAQFDIGRLRPGSSAARCSRSTGAARAICGGTAQNSPMPGSPNARPGPGAAARRGCR
jgi:glycerophosphoryl diester phosphodiesterase